MAALEEGGVQDGEVVAFSWPLEGTITDGSSVSLAFVVMRRQGGFMLAVPVDAIPSEDLDGATEDSLVGPHTVFSVPAVVWEEEERVFKRLGSDLEVLVVDLKEDALVGLEPFNAQVHTSDLVTGYVEDLGVVPEFSSVLAFTRQWVNVMDAQRISFYSADEGGTTPTAKLKAKAKTKGGVVPKSPKPMSAKKVAEAIGSMAEMMPMLQAQLVTMQEEQKRMQEALNLQSVQAAMRPGQAPVSSSLQDFMALTGPPPKTKGVTLKPPQPGAAIRAGDDECRPCGISSARTVESHHNFGSPSSARRSTDRRSPVIVGDIVKRSSGAGTPSERARRQNRWILSAGAPCTRRLSCRRP